MVLPCRARGAPLERASDFNASTHSYLEWRGVEDVFQDAAMAAMFAKETATLGLAEMQGNLYMSVRLGNALTAIARIDARSFCNATGLLPPLDRAHGNGVMLEMRSFTDHRMAAVRFVRLPQSFMPDLRHHLGVQAKRKESSEPATSIAGVFVGDERSLLGATEAVGEDCRVFGAYVSAEALGMKW
jgi:hypothetical protein